MKRLLVLFLACACATPAEPLVSSPAPAAGTIIGTYVLKSVDNATIPWTGDVYRGSLTGGGMVIGADSGWTVSDTSFSNIRVTIRWGGRLTKVSATAYTFRDSATSAPATRYSAVALDDTTFVLTDAASKAWKFVRR